MTFEEFCETLIFMGKVAGAFGALFKCTLYIIKCCKEAKEYFEEKPEVKLEHLKDQLADVRKEYKEILDQRKTGIFTFFEKISDEEKAKRKEEDTFFTKKKIALKREIGTLEENLGYSKPICILQ